MKKILTSMALTLGLLEGILPEALNATEKQADLTAKLPSENLVDSTIAEPAIKNPDVMIPGFEERGLMTGGADLVFNIMEKMQTGRDVRALLSTNKAMSELATDKDFKPRLRRIIDSKVDTIIETHLENLLEEALTDTPLRAGLRALGFYGEGQLSRTEARIKQMFEEDLLAFGIKKCSDSNSTSRNRIVDITNLWYAVNPEEVNAVYSLKNPEAIYESFKALFRAYLIGTHLYSDLPRLLKEAPQSGLRALGFYGECPLNAKEARIKQMFEEDLEFFKIKKCSDTNSALRNRITDMTNLWYAVNPEEVNAVYSLKNPEAIYELFREFFDDYWHPGYSGIKRIKEHQEALYAEAQSEIEAAAEKDRPRIATRYLFETLDVWLQDCGVPISREKIEYLIEKGANVNDIRDSKTPLHLAAQYGHVAAIKMLIDKGANVDAKSGAFGMAPLHYAADNGHVAATKMLIDNGATVNAKANHGKTPLHWAAGFGNTATIEMLINSGAQVTAKDDDDSIPLHDAAYYGNIAAIKMLINTKGVEVNAQAKHGMTPLHFAALSGKVAAIAELLDHHANVDAVDDLGLTPLDYAVKHENTAAIAELLDHHAAVDVIDKSGMTPLDYAVQNENAAAIEMLIKNGAARKWCSEAKLYLDRLLRRKRQQQS